jgi:hypothetical protein
VFDRGAISPAFSGSLDVSIVRADSVIGTRQAHHDAVCGVAQFLEFPFLLSCAACTHSRFR